MKKAPWIHMALSFSPLFVKLTVRGCSSPTFHYLKPLAKMTKKNVFAWLYRHIQQDIKTFQVTDLTFVKPDETYTNIKLERRCSYPLRGGVGWGKNAIYYFQDWHLKFPPHYFFKALSFPFCIELPVHTWTLNQSLWLISTPNVPYVMIQLWERTASHMPANIYGGRLQPVKRDSPLIHSKVRHYG